MQSCQVQMIKNLDSFRIVPDHFQKIFFRTLLDRRPPPPPPPVAKKISGTINYKYCTIFTQILHDYLYLNNKLRDFWLFGFFISEKTNTYGFSFEKTDNIFANCIFVRICEIFTTNRETWRSARKPGDSRLNRETWQLCICIQKYFFESQSLYIFHIKLAPIVARQSLLNTRFI